MDLSSYYEDFQSSYKLAICAVLLGLFAVIFVGVRLWRNKKETKITKIGCTILLAIYFAVVLNYFFTRGYPCKFDVEEQTIFYYEGDFEILETSKFINSKAVFSFENQEIELTYPFEMSEAIQPGKYAGKLVYGKHVGYVLYLDIYWER